MDAMTLTDKESLFVEAYLGDARCNGAKAARLAGFKGSPNTLSSVAYDLLRKPDIRAAIDARLDEVKARIGPERIYQFYADLLDSDITDIFTIDGDGQPRLNLNGARKAGRLGLIKSVAISKDGVKVEGYCKDAAVAAISKLLGLNAPERAPVDENGETVRAFEVTFVEPEDRAS